MFSRMGISLWTINWEDSGGNGCGRKDSRILKRELNPGYRINNGTQYVHKVNTQNIKEQ